MLALENELEAIKSQVYMRPFQANHFLARVNLDSAEITQFANNLEPFYEKYLDDPKEAQYKDDTTVMRYFVEYRCEPYLERFAGHDYANYPTVKRWAAELRRRFRV